MFVFAVILGILIALVVLAWRSDRRHKVTITLRRGDAESNRRGGFGPSSERRGGRRPGSL